jgi:predicted GIY-YIG superfamily endonuclease
MGYENSKIYKLQCESGHFYIGSTTNAFAKRLGQHKAKALMRPECRVYKHINGEWDKVRIILIEAVPCENKEQLNKKEDEYIQKDSNNPLCLNSKGAAPDKERRAAQNSVFDHAAYYQRNKESILAKMKKQYQENRDARLQKAREYREKKAE